MGPPIVMSKDLQSPSPKPELKKVLDAIEQATPEGSPGEARLAAEIRKRSGSDLEQYLRSLPTWQRQSAHLVAIRELGPRAAAPILKRSFGSTSHAQPSAQHTRLKLPNPSRGAVLDATRATALSDKIKREFDSGRPDLTKVVGLLDGAEPHVARAALHGLGGSLDGKKTLSHLNSVSDGAFAKFGGEAHSAKGLKA